MRKLRRKDEDGSILLLGLGLLAFLLIPLIGILAFSSRATTASVTANGLAISSANAALTRSIDQDATFQNRQAQLYSPGNTLAKTASDEVNTAVQSSWQVSQAGTGGDASLRMVAIGEQVNGFKFNSPDNPANPALRIGLINLPDNATSNYIQVKGSNTNSTAGCSDNGAFSDGAVRDDSNPDTPTMVCWVDHLAKNQDGSYATNRKPSGWLSALGDQQWDHYSSGAETLLEINMGAPWPLNLTSPYKAIFPGVATFSGSCASSQNCTQ